MRNERVKKDKKWNASKECAHLKYSLTENEIEEHRKSHILFVSDLFGTP